jgi:hypothetical protein
MWLEHVLHRQVTTGAGRGSLPGRRLLVLAAAHDDRLTNICQSSLRREGGLLYATICPQFLAAHSNGGISWRS